VAVYEERPPRPAFGVYKRAALGAVTILLLTAAAVATTVLLQVKEAVDIFRSALPFSDSFSATGETTLDANWQQVAGQFIAQNGNLVPATCGQNGLAGGRERGICNSPGGGNRCRPRHPDKLRPHLIEAPLQFAVVMIDIELQVDRKNQRPNAIATAHRHSLSAPPEHSTISSITTIGSDSGAARRNAGMSLQSLSPLPLPSPLAATAFLPCW